MHEKNTWGFKIELSLMIHYGTIFIFQADMSGIFNIFHSGILFSPEKFKIIQ